MHIPDQAIFEGLVVAIAIAAPILIVIFAYMKKYH